MTLQLLVNGNDWTKYLDQKDAAWSVSKNFSRQGDTASFTLKDDHKTVNAYTFTPSTFSTVVLQDTGINEVMFSGLCTYPKFTIQGPNLAVWTLDCVDWSMLADNAPVFGDQINVTAGQAIVNLVAKANCGLKAALTSEGGFVNPGPLIGFMRINYEALSKALKEISKYASQESNAPYGWRVDSNLNVHFQSTLQGISSGVTLTDDATQIGNLSHTLGFFDGGSNFTYGWDMTQIHNDITVLGGNMKGTRTDTWIADGSQTHYMMAFPIDTTVSIATLKLNGVTTPCTTVQASQIAPTSGWYVIGAMNGAWSLQNPLAAARGTHVELSYHYIAPVVAKVADFASIAAFSNLPNGGHFGLVDSNSTLQNLQQCQAEGQAQLVEYAYPREAVSLVTSPAWTGYVEIGQTFVLDDVLIPDIQNGGVGINAPYLVTGSTINGMPNNQRTMSITAVRV